MGKGLPELPDDELGAQLAVLGRTRVHVGEKGERLVVGAALLLDVVVGPEEGHVGLLEAVCLPVAIRDEHKADAQRHVVHVERLGHFQEGLRLQLGRVEHEHQIVKVPGYGARHACIGWIREGRV